MPIQPAAPKRTSAPRTSPAPKTATASPSLTPRDETRQQNVMNLMGAVSTFALLRGQLADAGAISAHGPKVAKELALLGKNNEPVGKVLDLLSQVGPYTGIVFATLPLLAQLAVNHGRIEAEKVAGIAGVKPKDLLEKQVKAELAEEEMRQRREIEQMEASIAAVRTTEEEVRNVPAA